MTAFEPKLGARASLALLAQLLSLILIGCAKTELGQQLADSFDAPPQQPPVENISPVVKTTNKTTSQAKKKLLKNEAKQRVSKPRQEKKQINRKERLGSMPLPTPRPYRITIKLSLADPSAPAEAVTKALRMAGVSFEVEMIERLEESSSRKSVSRGESGRR